MSNWIPVSERLPTREDADERGEVAWKWAGLWGYRDSRIAWWKQ